MNVDDQAVADWNALFESHQLSGTSTDDSVAISVSEELLPLLQVINQHPQRTSLVDELKNLLMEQYWNGYYADHDEFPR